MGVILGGSENVTINGKPAARAGDMTDGSGGGGTPGPPGPQGPKGPKGDNGAAATITIGTVVTGVVANVYNTGSNTAAVFNFVLPKGDPGANGSNGATGNTGSPGAAATITVGTVTTGAPGSNVVFTNSGNTSAAIFNITIPRGDVGANGATGNTGPIGNTGPQGLAATISVGNVVTSNAGSNAAITNSGNTSVAVFNFNIPKGDKGDIGDVASGTIFSDTAPSSGTYAGQRWMDTINGIEYVWYVDNNTSQWVEFEDSVTQPAQFSDTAPTGSYPGQRWMDTVNGIEYTWYVDADSAQWVEFSEVQASGMEPIDGGNIADTYVGGPYNFDGGSI